MAKTITLKVGMPAVEFGNVEELEVEVIRNPEGEFQMSENRTVPIETKSIEVKTSPGTRLTVAVKCFDKKRQLSNTVTRTIQVGDPMPPALADDISVEIVKQKT